MEKLKYIFGYYNNLPRSIHEVSYIIKNKKNKIINDIILDDVYLKKFNKFLSNQNKEKYLHFFIMMTRYSEIKNLIKNEKNNDKIVILNNKKSDIYKECLKLFFNINNKYNIIRLSNNALFEKLIYLSSCEIIEYEYLELAYESIYRELDMLYTSFSIKLINYEKI